MAAAPLLAASPTRSPLAVSSVTAAFYLPWLIAGLPAGALADRWPRRRGLFAGLRQASPAFAEMRLCRTERAFS
jgi:MFS family permease